MRLTVRVIEARNLRAMDSNGFSDPYVKLQLGKQRFKTKVIKMNLNPTWDQEFSFLVGDVKDVLKLDVYDEDILQMDDFLGQLRVPLEDVLAADDLSLGTRWYQLLPKGKTNKTVDCGNDRHSFSFVAHFCLLCCHGSFFVHTNSLFDSSFCWLPSTTCCEVQ
jgi:Ca2+-dependent lipid-binding protein